MSAFLVFYNLVEKPMNASGGRCGRPIVGPLGAADFFAFALTQNLRPL
jgi:hypothetical protein